MNARNIFHFDDLICNLLDLVNYTRKISFALISVLMHALPVGDEALARELARVAASGDRRSLV